MKVPNFVDVFLLPVTGGYLLPSLSLGRILLLNLMQPVVWWLHSLDSSPASSLLLVRQSLLPPASGTSSPTFRRCQLERDTLGVTKESQM